MMVSITDNIKGELLDDIQTNSRLAYLASLRVFELVSVLRQTIHHPSTYQTPTLQQEIKWAQTSAIGLLERNKGVTREAVIST